MKYIEKLKDPRWQKKRLQIMERAGWACESCGSGDKTLHIHHNYYQSGLEPWEYRDDTLYCLCEDCHLETQSTRADLAIEMARIPPGYEDLIIDCFLRVRRMIDKKKSGKVGG